MEFQYEKNRIYAQDSAGKLLAEITFPIGANNAHNIDHTFVDKSLRGQGVADQLMRAAVTQIRTSNRKTGATCSYAAQWFAAHPEESDILIQ